MNANQDFFIVALLLSAALLVNVYLLYGRVKRKSLVGGYDPGTAGYDVFIRLVDNTKYFVASVVVTILLCISMVFSVRAVIQDLASDSILVIAPIMIFIGFALTFTILPKLIGKK